MKSVTGRSLIAVYFLKLFKSSCKPDMASRDWTAWLLDWPEPPHGAATAVSQSGFIGPRLGLRRARQELHNRAQCGASHFWIEVRLFDPRDYELPLTPVPRCAVPECHGISHADPIFREALWDRFFTAAPRPRTPSELLYSDRRLRSKSSPAATILIRKR